MADITVPEPFPIFKVADRYLLFDINTITYIRREYHICGVLVGNIPQASQQTVFSGIPLVLLPEETRLLVERAHAFVLDDVVSHKNNMTDLSPEARKSFLASLEREGTAAAEAVRQQAEDRKIAYFAKARWENKLGKSAKPKPKSIAASAHSRTDSDDFLFSSPANSFPTPRATPSPTPINESPKPVQPMSVTPTTSYPPYQAEASNALPGLPEVPSSYPLFRNLHDNGYYMMPGLRFGCQYGAYPGDPLRFHSHFLATGREWDEEIDLLDIVAGGRLGTGVKKGYLVGGAVTDKDGKASADEDVRTFTFEWAAM